MRHEHAGRTRGSRGIAGIQRGRAAPGFLQCGIRVRADHDGRTTARLTPSAHDGAFRELPHPRRPSRTYRQQRPPGTLERSTLPRPKAMDPRPGPGPRQTGPLEPLHVHGRERECTVRSPRSPEGLTGRERHSGPSPAAPHAGQFRVKREISKLTTRVGTWRTRFHEPMWVA